MCRPRIIVSCVFLVTWRAPVPQNQPSALVLVTPVQVATALAVPPSGLVRVLVLMLAQELTLSLEQALAQLMKVAQMQKEPLEPVLALALLHAKILEKPSTREQVPVPAQTLVLVPMGLSRQVLAPRPTPVGQTPLQLPPPLRCLRWVQRLALAPAIPTANEPTALLEPVRVLVSTPATTRQLVPLELDLARPQGRARR